MEDSDSPNLHLILSEALLLRPRHLFSEPSLFREIVIDFHLIEHSVHMSKINKRLSQTEGLHNEPSLFLFQTFGQLGSDDWWWLYWHQARHRMSVLGNDHRIPGLAHAIRQFGKVTCCFRNANSALLHPSRIKSHSLKLEVKHYSTVKDSAASPPPALA